MLLQKVQIFIVPSFLCIKSCDSDSWAELLLAFTSFFFLEKMFVATICGYAPFWICEVGFVGFGS